MNYPAFSILILFLLSAIFVRCQINVVDDDISTGNPKAEYRENFAFSKSMDTRNELSLSNINGAITIIGIEELNEVQVSGAKVVKARTLDEAKLHIGDI